MQDVDAPATADIQEPPKPAEDVVMTPPRQVRKNEPESDGLVNKADRVIPEPDEEQKTGKSKFAITHKQLTPQEMNKYLNVDGLDESKVQVKDAWLKGSDVHIELANGESLIVGRNADGYAQIRHTNSQNPDAATMMAMAEIAKAKGWKDIDVTGNSQEFRALSYFAITNAGLIMNNPPNAQVLEEYRERFEQTLKTGVDPVAQERREKAAEAEAKKEAAAAAAAKDPDAEADVTAPATKEPAAKAPEAKAPTAAAPETKTRPTVRTSAPAMR